MRPGILWTPDEDARLRDFYAQDTPGEIIAAALGRSVGAIRNRASAIGISSPERTRRVSRKRLLKMLSDPEFKSASDAARTAGNKRYLEARRAQKPPLSGELRSYRRKLIRSGGLTPDQADREIQKLIRVSKKRTGDKT